MISARSFAVALVAMIAATGATASTLVTTQGAYSGPTLNLSPFSNGSYNFTFGPVTVGAGLTFTASPGGGGNSGRGSVVGQGSYGLNANGNFGGSATYIGLDSGTGFAQINFSTAQTQFYGFWNYAPGVGDNATLSTLDAANNVLQTFDLTVLAPISTPNGNNAFAFRGIEGTTQFNGIRFGGNFILLAATANGGAVGGIPEPSSWAMLITGFGLVGAAARRRRVAVA